jgi:two-component system sensor histidine kinase SenX3
MKKIQVRVTQVNGWIDIAVTDNGMGIPEAEQQKIFEKFYRGSNAVAGKIRGSGIGLSLTRHVAEMHGGDVLVRSEPGQGSTFTLRIRIRTPPELAN